MDNKGQKWYFKSWSLAVSFFFIGPLMLPLVWVNPGFTKKKKIVISVVILIFTCLLAAIFLRSLKYLDNYYKFLQNEIY
ncbi:MAG: hypothetical protein PHC37_04300 [Candidatus Omnitrophica bacterium]|jgi:hypothetical protein|nr:hypothetical protein [Candidatus Omnitrophota bacterium]MDD5690896.1 hypothetical protein [Candidatus Omnitrophota bacterium]